MTKRNVSTALRQTAACTQLRPNGWEHRQRGGFRVGWGQIAHNIWYEESLFKTKSTPDTNRVVVQAVPVPG